MRHLVTGLMTTLLLLACNGAARADDYYARLSFWESPVQALRPELPLTESEAKSRSHIRVKRDAQHRITEFSVRLGDTVKDIEGFYGNLYLHAPITRVAYAEHKEIHTFFNRFGHAIDGWGVRRKIYQLDEFGRYVRLSFEDAAGQAASNSWGISEYRWHYPLDGSVIEERVNASGELQPHRPRFEFQRIRMLFDPRGHLSLMQNIDKAGHLVPSASGAAQYRYLYDAEGRFIRWELYDADGKPAQGPTDTAGEINVYRGNELRSISFFGPDGQPTLHTSGAARWTLDHDRFGNVIQLSYAGLHGEPVSSVYGVGQRRYRFGDDGAFLLGISLHDVDGHLQNEPDQGWAETRLIRDSHNRITTREFRDADGQLVNRKDSGVAFERYDYDERGEISSTTQFDREGRRR